MILPDPHPLPLPPYPTLALLTLTPAPAPILTLNRPLSPHPHPRGYILRYLRQIAVITPYAQFSFRYVAEDPKNSLEMHYKRRTDVMPPAPRVGGEARGRRVL